MIFTQAYNALVDYGGEVVNSAFILDVESTYVFNTDAAGPKDKGKGKGKTKTNGGGRGIDHAVEAFMNKNPPTADMITFAKSTACSYNEQHILVESTQPYDVGVWSCQEYDCKGQVSANMKDKLVGLRLNKSSVGSF